MSKAQTDRSRSTENSKISKIKQDDKNIVDLNLIGDKSKLSSHYMHQTVGNLSDLKLNDSWPKSNMYKFSIQSNPWVNAFKERSYANEINSNFRDFPTLSLKKNHNYIYMSSRIETKPSLNLFPSIKQIT